MLAADPKWTSSTGSQSDSVEATPEFGPVLPMGGQRRSQPTANAFCLPGGKIVVYTGILPVARDEASLATVMGHEMAQCDEAGTALSSCSNPR